jgi:ABC-type glycerol-3-phosphate transport system permease component
MIVDLAERVLKPGIVRGVALYTALIGIAWCSLFPILWAVSGSLKNEGEVTRPKLFPSHPQWSNYREVFAVMPFGECFSTLCCMPAVSVSVRFSFARWPDMPSRGCGSEAVIRCLSCIWALLWCR